MSLKKLLFLSGILFIAVAASILYFHFFSFKPNNWVTKIPEMGSSSSPRAIDLNQDGILDLVIGGGRQEFERTNYGVLALDGRDGAILWNITTRNQVVGSAIFQDITSDGVPDVFIGGRSAILLAIDGRQGNIIWEFQEDIEGMDLISDTSYLNFFSPQFIPDTDGDGLDDLLTAFGGYIKAKPTEAERPQGSLMVISAKDGRLLNQLYMPDGQETYMSPLVHDFEKRGALSVIFGSGGETMNGHLYKMRLKDLLNNNTSSIKVLANGQGKGFIASPVLTDVDLDGILDLVVNSVDGRMICLNGQTDEVQWAFSIGSDYEVYTMPTPGFFIKDDSIPDFYASLGHGPWPDTDYTLHILIDGSNGELWFSDTLGLFQYASPIVYNFNQDNRDDILLVINDRKVFSQLGGHAKYYVNDLFILDGKKKVFYNLGSTKLGSNLGSTPLIVDLDNDSRLDIIHCYMNDGNNFYSFKNSIIERTELKIKNSKDIPWGNFMGRGFDGIFKVDQ